MGVGPRYYSIFLGPTFNLVTSILETKAVIEDCRANAIGGLAVGIEIWELAIIPQLLNNSETWTNLENKTLEVLENIQLMFYRNLFATPRTCPVPALLWETGGMLMELRIDKKKLVFFHHIFNLPEKSLAKEIAETQIKYNYPGLVTECLMLMKKYNLQKLNKKNNGKKILDKAFKEHNKRKLLMKKKRQENWREVIAV